MLLNFPDTAGKLSRAHPRLSMAMDLLYNNGSNTMAHKRADNTYGANLLFTDGSVDFRTSQTLSDFVNDGGHPMDQNNPEVWREFIRDLENAEQ